LDDEYNGSEVSSKEDYKERDSLSKKTTTLRLKEAFEGLHKWAKAKGNLCTSLNASRGEWIDQIWYSSQTLAVKEITKPRIEAQGSLIPDIREYPSDHIPMGVKIQLQHPKDCRICRKIRECLDRNKDYLSRRNSINKRK